MMQKVSKKRIFVLLLFVVLAAGGFLISNAALAQDFGTGYLGGATLPSDDIRIVILNIIRIALGALGVIFLLFVLWAGFLWMTAGGNPQQVQRAQKILVNAIIGLVIIFMAFAITTFVFNILQGSTNSGGTGGSCTDGAISGCSRCTGGVWNYDPALCPLPGSEFRINSLNTANGSGDDSQDVYLCSSVQAQFNNVIDASTVPGNTRITQGGAPVAVTVNTTSRSIDMVPDTQLAPNTSYTAHYSQALTDAGGLALSACSPLTCGLSGSEFQWNFTTGTSVDTSAPSIISSSPTSDLTSPGYPDRNVYRDKVISVSFTENVRASTIDDGTGSPIAANIFVEQLDGQGGNVVATLPFSDYTVVTKSNGFDLRLNAPNLYDAFTWYRVTVQNVEDLCGNPMAAPAIWEFQTNDKAPGVGGHYPTGTNVCPAVGVITLSFNTSMYYDTVSLTVSPGSPSATPLISTAMRPVDLAPGPYNINTPEGLWVVDPASNFTTFTFSINDPLQTNTQYFVSVTTDRVMDVNGNTLNHAWDFTVSDAASCTCAPYISSINPRQGLLGQCVTISGQCFNGAVPGDSNDPRYAEVSSLSFDGIPAVIGSQSNNYIISSIPTVFASGDTVLPDLTITYINEPVYGSLSTNNTNVDFFVSSGDTASGPCLLSIQPGQACFGSSLQLNGERFGSDPGTGNRSTTQHNVIYNDGALQAADSEVIGWSDTRITSTVPVGTFDGGVAVTAGGLVSNTVPFNLACGVGSSCSRDPFTCSADSSLCSSGLTCNTSSCLCEAPTLPTAPRVINPFPSCALSCINATIGAQFDRDMAAGTISSASIDVLPCSDTSCSSFGSEIGYTSFTYDPLTRQVDIVPSSNLAISSNYRVVFYDTISSTEGANLGGLNYDRDGNGTNDSYSWTFGTKDEVCALSSISLEPAIASADRGGQVITYNAYAQGSNDQCSNNQNINPWSYDWAWVSSNTGVASITVDDTNGDSQTDPRQFATALAEGTTNITASTGAFSAVGTLSVDFITCSDTTDCTQGGTCPGSVCDDGIATSNPNPTNTCTPVITGMSPATGPVGQWTTISGCHFESSQGSGSVTFSGTQALYPSCSGGQWQNDQIIVEVPSVGTGANPVIVNTNRGLSTNTSNFNVSNQCSSGSPAPPTGVPGICRIVPTSGAVGIGARIDGGRFTNNQNVVTFQGSSGRAQAPIGSWGDTQIQATVPLTSVTGDVLVEVNSCPSNGVQFQVTGGIGTACDGNINTAQCEVNDGACGPINNGLYCDPSSCTCQSPPPPAVNSVVPGVNASNVCLNSVITADFNQMMDRGSLQGNVSISPPLNLNLSFIDIDVNGNGSFERSIDSTRVIIDPVGELSAATTYTVTIGGGPNPVLSQYGLPMASNYVWSFTTGATACEIARVTTTITPPGRLASIDRFNCSGNNCVGDTDNGSSGNQHTWNAQAYDSSTPIAQPLSATYTWVESDPDSIFSFVPAALGQAVITPALINGRATFTVTADDPLNPSYGSASANVRAVTDLCENPWPSPTNYPYQDTDTDFSFWYCRDRGSKKICYDSSGSPTTRTCSTSSNCLTGESCRGDISDDLPNLAISEDTSPPGNIIKQFLLLPPAPASDAIALAVYDNPGYLSPDVWYQRNVPNPGSPFTTSINGYAAVREGRTVYVSAAEQTGGSSHSANIYVLSYSNNASSDVKTIYDELLNNWNFTLNSFDLNICTGDPSRFCESDSECSSVGAGTCQIAATKIRRDAQRVTDLGGIRSLLYKYRGICENDSNQGCSPNVACPAGAGACIIQNPDYPDLAAGSFVAGQSTSKWPSWNQTLGQQLGVGKLQVDPLNFFNGCPAGSDPDTCWNDGTSTFSCPAGSRVYLYEKITGTRSVLRANLESTGVNWTGVGTTCGGNSCANFCLLML